MCDFIFTLLGLAAAGYYNSAGASSNYHCLPETPHYDAFQSGTSSYRGYMYSVEYYTSDFSPFTALHGHDAPCALCRVEHRGTVTTIPALMSCPQGWTREYHGYLMGERHNHARAGQAVCVDREPEMVPGTVTYAAGAFFFAIEARCDGDGNLPCAPYTQEHELTCVVCSL